ncbi:MAG: hypothetical protein HZB53_19100 [Chloroflexi bacterium]|nr:hypothetical protein [Chloroflexota bacterium]
MSETQMNRTGSAAAPQSKRATMAGSDLSFPPALTHGAMSAESMHFAPVAYQQVEDALEHLWDYDYLGHHELATRTVLALQLEYDHALATRHVRGHALNRLLQAAITQARRQQAFSPLNRSRSYGELLHWCYVEREKNSNVAQRLGWAERSFYRHRRSAVQMLTNMLTSLDNPPRSR